MIFTAFYRLESWNINTEYATKLPVDSKVDVVDSLVTAIVNRHTHDG